MDFAGSHRTSDLSTTWVELLQVRAARSGQREAFRFFTEAATDEARLTYAQLDEQARAVATPLRASCKVGDRALLLYPPGLEFVVGLFGCWYAGLTAVPAYPPRSAHHAGSLATLQGIAANCEPSVVLTAARTKSMIESATQSIPALANVQLLASDDAATTNADAWRMPEITAHSTALLQYTSGSTAAPKGVMITHANLLHNSAIICECFGQRESSRGVIWLPPFHDMGLIGGILQPVYSRSSVVLMAPAAFLQRPLRWLQAVSDYRATASGGPNFAYELCIKHGRNADLSKLDLSTWEVAFNGAEPVDPQTLGRFAETFAPCGFRREAFYPCYGLAESTLIVSGGKRLAPLVTQSVCPDALENHQVVKTAHGPESKAFVSCGHSHADSKIAIVDPVTATRCPEGRIGEIWTRSASVARGYWRNPAATAETFGAHLADTLEGPFLRTGDLGFLDGNELFVTGRLKDLIIIRGRNHYPQDIEQTAQECHTALRPDSGAAFAVDVDGSEQLVLVQEVERTQRDADLNAVIDAIREAITEKHEIQVSAVVLLKPGGVLKTSSGKIRRSACRAAYVKGELEPLAQWIQPSARPTDAAAAPIEPATPQTPRSAEEIENSILAKLASALRLSPDEIDPGETFARYGLDSAGAMEIAGALERELGRELPGTLFYDYPSPRDLAAHLAGGAAREVTAAH
jgi:acyl-CoA synthetase (AMP-forming)/AMP-acid ligase II/acyl carrier protein